jgi:hypothetical protein
MQAVSGTTRREDSTLSLTYKSNQYKRLLFMYILLLMVRCVAFVRNALNAPPKIVALNFCMIPQFAPSLPLHIENHLHLLRCVCSSKCPKYRLSSLVLPAHCVRSWFSQDGEKHEVHYLQRCTGVGYPSSCLRSSLRACREYM